MARLVVRLQDLSPEELAELRNEAEIAIFHARDKLNDLTIWIYTLCALEAGIGLLGRDPSAVAVPALVALLTSEVRSRASIAAGVAFCALGVASIFGYPRVL